MNAGVSKSVVEWLQMIVLGINNKTYIFILGFFWHQLL